METTNFKDKPYKLWYMLLFPFLGIIFLVIAVTLVSPVEYANSDFFKFWLSGRLAITGQNPYDSQVWIAGHHKFGADWIPEPSFLYPLPTSLLFVPLGLFPLYQAFIAWDILSQFMIFSSVALLLMLSPKASAKRFILPLTAGVILFRPMIITLVNGQVSGILLLLVACIIYLWERGKWEQGTFLLAFIALKPNLGAPLILLLAIYLIQKKQIKSLAVGTVSGIFLLFAGFAQNPNWLVEFWNTGNGKLSQTFGFSPTIWGISAFFCNYNLDCAIGVGAIISLFFLAGYLYLIAGKQNTLPPSQAISLAIVIVLLLTPYTWPYDQLLLVVPIVTIMMQLDRDGYKYFLVSLIFLAIDIYTLILLAVSAKIQMEIWNATIPFFVFIFLFWSLKKNKIDSKV